MNEPQLNDTQRRIASLAACAEAFGRQLTPAALRMMARAVEDVLPAAIDSAAMRAIQTCKFMPSVAELRQLAGEHTPADRSMLAWQAAEQAVAIGPYRHVSFDDPLINATIRNLGGWVTFVSRFSGAESEKWTRKEFCDTYQSLSRMGVGGEVTRPLAGLSEARVVAGKLLPPEVEEIDTGLPWVSPDRPRLGVTGTPRIADGEGGAA